MAGTDDRARGLLGFGISKRNNCRIHYIPILISSLEDNKILLAGISAPGLGQLALLAGDSNSDIPPTRHYELDSLLYSL